MSGFIVGRDSICRRTTLQSRDVIDFLAGEMVHQIESTLRGVARAASAGRMLTCQPGRQARWRRRRGRPDGASPEPSTTCERPPSRVRGLGDGGDRLASFTSQPLPRPGPQHSRQGERFQTFESAGPGSRSRLRPECGRTQARPGRITTYEPSTPALKELRGGGLRGLRREGHGREGYDDFAGSILKAVALAMRYSPGPRRKPDRRQVLVAGRHDREQGPEAPSTARWRC